MRLVGWEAQLVVRRKHQRVQLERQAAGVSEGVGRRVEGGLEEPRHALGRPDRLTGEAQRAVDCRPAPSAAFAAFAGIGAWMAWLRWFPGQDLERVPDHDGLGRVDGA